MSNVCASPSGTGGGRGDGGGGDGGGGGSGGSGGCGSSEQVMVPNRWRLVVPLQHGLLTLVAELRHHHVSLSTYDVV